MNALNRIVRHGGLVLSVLLATACGDGGSGPPKPASIQSNAVLPATAPVGSAVTASVRVTDSKSTAVPGVGVTFEVSAGGGSVTSTSVSTDASGVASVAWTLGTTAGANTLLAKHGSLAPVTMAVSGTAVAAAAIGAAPGNPTQGTAGVALATRPGVRVTDQYGNPVGGVSVTFTAGAGSGIVTGGAQPTAADGIARPGGWTLGQAAGPQTLQATAGSVNQVIQITAVAGPADTLIAVSAGTQAGTAGAAVGDPPSVRAEDQFGNVVAGASVTFAVASGGGAVTGGTQATNAAGIATVGSWTLGGVAGANTMTATTPGYTGPPVTFTATSGAAAGANLAVSTQPSALAQSGLAFAQQPVVRVRDAFGNNVATAGVVVTAAIASGGGTLGGTTTATTNASGAATFTNLSITGTAGNRTLTFTASGLGAATSNTIEITTVATQIAINAGDGQTGAVGSAVATPPSVVVRDVNNDPVGGVSVTFAVASGGGSLGGSGTVLTNASGIATSPAWTLGTTPGANSLTASSGALAGSPVTFNATATVGAAAVVVITTQPSASAQTNIAFAQQPVVRLRDAFGNNVSEAGVVVTASIATGGGTLGGTATATTNASGIATFTNLSINGTAGNRTLSFAATSLTSATSNNIAITIGAASQIAVNAGDNQSGVVSLPLPVAPSVRVTDAGGNGVAGVNVVFAVASGGGSLGGSGSVNTNASGIATSPAWTLGATAGPNTLTATSGALAGSPITFTATGQQPVLAIAKLAGDNTTCPINASGCVFSVRVTHSGTGQPISGETVVWSNGAAPTVSTVTNSRGIATTGNIPPNNATGARTQIATIESSGAQVTFNYTLVTGAGYNIDIRYAGLNPPTPGVQAAFNSAKLRWEAVITGDLPNIAMTGGSAVPPNVCGITHPGLDEVVDDLVVLISVEPIDGPGSVLGSAGPCYIRTSGGFPIIGVMRLDSADLATLEGNGGLTDVLIHELGHVIGFPFLWGDSFNGLLEDSATANPYYSGARGFADYVVAGGTPVNEIGVPVENTGGEGTRNGHWRESVMSTELMTGFISLTANPLSRITVGAMFDVGYQVNFGAADTYLVPGASALRAAETIFELRELPLPPPRVVR